VSLLERVVLTLAILAILGVGMLSLASPQHRQPMVFYEED
jgi:hypothetical protein